MSFFVADRSVRAFISDRRAQEKIVYRVGKWFRHIKDRRTIVRFEMYNESYHEVMSLIRIVCNTILLSYVDAAQFDYVFAENGLVAFKDGVEFKRQVCIDQ